MKYFGHLTIEYYVYDYKLFKAILLEKFSIYYLSWYFKILIILC